MKEVCDLKIEINGHHTFFLDQNILFGFSGRLRKMKGLVQMRSFPGGPEGFELASRFCYGNGRVQMSPSNIAALHCAAVYLEIQSLKTQTEAFLMEGVGCWSLGDVVSSLKSCEPFFEEAESAGISQKLASCLVSKVLEPAGGSPRSSASLSSSSSAEAGGGKEWWFEELAALGPRAVDRIAEEMRGCGRDLVRTRFLLYYLKSMPHRRSVQLQGIAERAVDGMVKCGRDAFSCRGLFWVLRLVSRMGIGRNGRGRVEWMIGACLDMAELDDLLVSGHGEEDLEEEEEKEEDEEEEEGVYDVSMVMRLVRVFVGGGEVSAQRMKKVGRLMDKYLREISPDQGLKPSKFMSVAESLPDYARDCCDGVYRALEIFLESHPDMSFEERTRLCQCLNYEKLTLEACKDLAKNPKIPPGVAVQALISQQLKPRTRTSEKTRGRAAELENSCYEMRGQMFKLERGRYAISSPAYYSSKGMPRLC